MEYGVHAAHKGANFNLYTGVVWNSIPTSVGVVWHHGEEAGHAPGTLWHTLWLTLWLTLPLWHADARALDRRRRARHAHVERPHERVGGIYGSLCRGTRFRSTP